MTSEPLPAAAPQLAARLEADVAALDRELAEIELLVGQARAEAARHEQKRAQAAERLSRPDPRPGAAETAEAYGQLMTLSRRAVLMESQAEVLEGKRRSLARYRDALSRVVEALAGMPPPELFTGEGPAAGPEDAAGDGEGGVPDPAVPHGTLPPSISRVVLNAQEDLRREIARGMHDGPAQSLTNIVLQAQIVERLMERDPSRAREELRQLVAVVQQTLDATKNFIFDVRPMVLDDLGLVPTLRRATRDRGRRAQVPVEFESLGTDRRLPVDVESAVFRILDEALGAYLSLSPERITLQLDWTEELEARLAAHRTPSLPAQAPLPAVPTGDVPDAIKQMIQDRHDARAAAVAAAEAAAVVALPAGTRRELLERARSIGATVEVLAGGGEVRLVVALPPAEDAARE